MTTWHILPDFRSRVHTALSWQKPNVAINYTSVSEVSYTFTHRHVRLLEDRSERKTYMQIILMAVKLAYATIIAPEFLFKVVVRINKYVTHTAG